VEKIVELKIAFQIPSSQNRAVGFEKV